MPEALAPILREIPEELVVERVLLRPYRPGDGAQLWEAINESREHHLPWIPWGEGNAASMRPHYHRQNGGHDAVLDAAGGLQGLRQPSPGEAVQGIN